MTVLYIIGGILLFFCLILLCPVSIRISYSEKFKAVLRILFFRFPLSGEQKQPDPRDYTAKALRKRAAKLRRKQKKQKRDAAKKAARKKKTDKKKEGKKKKTDSVTELLPVILRIVKNLVRRLGKYLRIEVARCDIVIATPDAAKTAILYGTAAGTLAALSAELDRLKNFRGKSRRNISLRCDFLSEKTSADIDLRFRLLVWQIAVILLEAGLAFVLRGKGKKAKTERNNKNGHNDGSQDKCDKDNERRYAEARAALVEELMN